MLILFDFPTHVLPFGLVECADDGSYPVGSYTDRISYALISWENLYSFLEIDVEIVRIQFPILSECLEVCALHAHSKSSPIFFSALRFGFVSTNKSQSQHYCFGGGINIFLAMNEMRQAK